MNDIVSFLISVPLVIGALTGIGFVDASNTVFESVEVGVAEISPKGASGGYIIPASGGSVTSCPAGQRLVCTRGARGEQNCRCERGTTPVDPSFTCGLSVSPSSIVEGDTTTAIKLTRTANPNTGDFSTREWLDGSAIGDSGGFTTSGNSTWDVSVYGAKGRPTSVGVHTYTQEAKRRVSGQESDWVQCSPAKLTVTDPGDPDLRATKPTTPTDTQAGDHIRFAGGEIENIGDLIAENFQNRYQIALHGDEGNLVELATGLLTLGAGRSVSVKTNNAWTAVAGAHRVRLVADTDPHPSGRITESNEKNNASSWTAFTVAGKSLPQCSDGIDNDDPEDELADTNDPGCRTDPDDPTTYDPEDDDEVDPVSTTANLVAGAPSIEGTLIEGETLILTDGNVENAGDADINTRFNNRYEIDLDRDGVVEVRRATGLIYSLEAGGTVYVDDKSWVAEEGKHRIRFVADFKNNLDEGADNEKDNFSPWVNFTVQPPNDGPQAALNIRKIGSSLWSNSVTIDASDDVELQWSSTDANRCAGDEFSTGAGNPTSGVQSTVSEPASGTRKYTVTCYNDDTDTKASDTVTVRIGTTISGPPTIDADPLRLRQGDSSRIQWNTNGNANCAISGNGEAYPVPIPSGSRNSLPIFDEVIYTITCDGGGNADSVTIRVLPTFEEF